MTIIRHRKLSDPSSDSSAPPLSKRLSTKTVELFVWILFLSLFPLLGWICVKKIKPQKALVHHRLGGQASVKYSGFTVILPLIDSAKEIALNPQNLIVPPSMHYSKDRLNIEAGLIVGYKISDPAACVRELQDINESVLLASKAALPSVLASTNSNMILCSKKLLEYSITKKIHNAVCLWGIEILSAELSPFQFKYPKSDEPAAGGGIETVVNFIQKLAGHNPLPPKEKFSINEMIVSLKPYLTRSVGDKVDAVILMELTGENGGKCLIDFKTCSMVPNPTTCHPDVIIELSVETLLSMIDDRRDLIDVYKSGEVKISGDLEVAAGLRHLF